MSEIVIHVQLKTLSGLATCDVCGSLYSFDRPPEQLERVHCPRCGSGSGRLHDGTICSTVEITEGPKGV